MPEDLPKLEPDALHRYSRQILLDEIGMGGQQKLAAAKVLIVGVGGLGSPAAFYLAAAGVGTLGIADHDLVEDHNLQRQILHTSAKVGQPKVDSAIEKLRELNPQVRLIPHREGITAANAVEIFQSYDIILDGTDNFAVRYLNNDAACLARRPLIHGSVFKFEGQVSVFDPVRGGPCYRCLFPEAPTPGSVPGCGEAGVIGALCGVIGSIQAMEAVKLITGCAPALRGRLLTYDGLSQQLHSHNIAPDPNCPLCGTVPIITAIQSERYQPKCEQANPAKMKQTEYPDEISATEASKLLRAKPEQTTIIDVREPNELQICRLEAAQHIPIRQIPAQWEELAKDQHLLILCHHGNRSRMATQFLRGHGLFAVTNIAGGINAWAIEVDQSLARY